MTTTKGVAKMNNQQAIELLSNEIYHALAKLPDIKENLDEPEFINHAITYAIMENAIIHYDEFLRNEEGYTGASNYLHEVLVESVIKVEEETDEAVKQMRYDVLIP